MDNDLILWDRLEVIKTTIQKYGEENFYLSFSGGKDSTVVHHLLDMALPDNKIPRVFSNTGIEYKANVDFVKSQNDDRFVIIPPTKNIPQTLNKVGYPFKSKLYSQHYETYRKHKEQIHEEIKKIEADPSLKHNYDYIHNLPRGVKTAIKYIYNLRESNHEIYAFYGFP
jgi:3'-phosphoadenosine 5'-phosphosulfate sulfotransferase (PAPS reductase)/FAD synthetase